MHRAFPRQLPWLNHPSVVRFAILTGLVACGGGGGGTTAPPVTPVVTTITVSLAASSLEAGTTTTASAAVLDQNNAAITGKTVAWSSDNQSVATVTSTGVVTGVAPGTANIIATLDGKDGRASSTITGWVFDGAIFTNADFGGKAGGLADVAVIRLNDGRFRMFIGANPAGASILSAISTDGVKFTLEAGQRLNSPYDIGGKQASFRHRPVVFRLDDGRLRLFAIYIDFFNNGVTPGFYSFTSSDEGLTWTLDPGVRLTTAATGLNSLATGAIVKAKGGGWRFYFSDDPPSTTGSNGQVVQGDPRIMSAFSTDLVTWTMDAGVRIGIGATLSGNGQTPAGIVNADGSITLVYFRNKPGFTMQSTSTDGISFTAEQKTGFGVNDRFPVIAFDNWLTPLPNGDARLYFDYGNETAGTIYTAHHTAFTATK